MSKQPTTAQSWLGHSLEGLAVMTAVTTVAVLLPQIQSGSFSWQGVAAALLSAGLTVGSKYGAGVLTNPQTPQAIHDAVTQAIQAQPAQQPIVINNHIPTAQDVQGKPEPNPLLGQVPVSAINPANITTASPSPLAPQQFQRQWTSLETPIVKP